LWSYVDQNNKNNMITDEGTEMSRMIYQAAANHPWRVKTSYDAVAVVVALPWKTLLNGGCPYSSGEAKMVNGMKVLDSCSVDMLTSIAKEIHSTTAYIKNGGHNHVLISDSSDLNHALDVEKGTIKSIFGAMVLASPTVSYAINRRTLIMPHTH